MSYLVDTNILLRSIDTEHEMYPMATNAVERIFSKGEQIYITSQNLIEFWNVYTRPKEKNGFGCTTEEARMEIDRLKEIFILLPDTKEAYIQWEHLVTTYKVKGVNVHDAKLVASMLANDLQKIITFNTDDFQRYKEITTVHPNEVLS